jgi:hypothetical protein
MQNIRTSLQGQKINFDQFVAYNDKTKAVGNMRVNARGDIIDASGNILKTRTEIMKQKFIGSTNVSHRKTRTGKTKAQNTQSSQNNISNESQTEDQYEDQNEPQNIWDQFGGRLSRVEQIQNENRYPTVNQNYSGPSQLERIQQFGPRSSDLRGSLASDIEIDLSEVTKPSDIRTLRRI